MAEYIPEDLFVGEPRLVVRWRLHHRALPLQNRHLHAFAGAGISNGLLSWARQHIEWTLAQGTAACPNGVLVLAVDDEGRAVMSVEDYEPLPALTAAMLVERAGEQASQAVEGEVAWIARDGGLIALTSEAKPLSGANSLVADLAKTLHMPVLFAADADASSFACEVGDEVMLVSDEHGVVSAQDTDAAVAARFRGYYDRLVSLTKPDAYDCANLGITG